MRGCGPGGLGGERKAGPQEGADCSLRHLNAAGTGGTLAHQDGSGGPAHLLHQVLPLIVGQVGGIGRGKAACDT